MNTQLNITELDIIYECLEDCLNSDDWEFKSDPISKTMTKIDEIRRAKRGWSYG
jgi:hypothetical protein